MCAEHIFKLGRLLSGEFHIAEFALTEQRNLARFTLVRQCDDRLARLWNFGESVDFVRKRRTGSQRSLAVFVEHRAHTSIGRAASRSFDSGRNPRTLRSS